ncbi:type VI secretion system tip protein TssI/VgrG [Stutzerimonas nitrititolerans]|uniref:type VI secretion system Vgr family protein n=1 Tax=Stutzerimonas nitrititolerans TaxID=2482751 RepID=UPI0028A85935|nr:type VI secretion system tip protein TssI/VgrG [Stutzerimonas nitrititolerans]
MFDPANESHFNLSIEGVEHDFKVLQFRGREAISQPYRFELEAVSERPDIDLQGLLHQSAFLAFTSDGAGIHGQLHSVAQGQSGKRLTRYRLVMVPRLAYLAHRTNQQIHQHLSVPQIVAQVLEANGIQADGYRFQLGPTQYPEREYCVQYDETDLHFIQRLCAEEGIHYHFEHSAEGHVLVFGDDQTSFPRLGRPTAYVQGSGLVADEPVIKSFGVRVETRTTRVSRRDYNFEKPRLLMEAASQGEQNPQAAQPDLEDYDYPGRFTDRTRGKYLSQRNLERHRSDYRLADGRSDQPRLVSGHLLEISEHPRREWNDLWLLNEVIHEGKQPQVLEESITLSPGPHIQTLYPLGREDWDEGSSGTDFQQGYRNHFTAIPWDIPYRPPFEYPKPKVLGGQTAVVTGPAGEEIHCDEYGRVKVQFYWDREGLLDDKSSCWLRVSSNWAGDRYGGIAIPRVGMEVLVTFLEGDPDQPLVTGCLYHAEHVPPYELPANKTCSVFKTLSSPGGDGYNELRIEDRKGAEQIYVHAQRDWDQNIQHDQKIRVGHERHDTVEANSYSELRAEEHLTVTGERKVEVKPQDHLTIATDQHVKLGASQLTRAGREIHLKAGQKMVIEAGIELTLKAGGSFIKLDPGGISLSGPLARINAGGAPGKGSGITILMPLIPLPADMDKAGALLNRSKPGVLPATDAMEPHEYLFNIRLQDIPGDEGFPLAHTPWRILEGNDDKVLLGGETDEQGHVLLDDKQQQILSTAYCKAPKSLWLAYPGQCVALRLHLEREGWDAEQHALAALDFRGCITPNQMSNSLLQHERGKQDSLCSTDLYTHLQSKE